MKYSVTQIATLPSYHTNKPCIRSIYMDHHHDVWFVDRYSPQHVKVLTYQADTTDSSTVHINVHPDPPALCELVGKCLVRSVMLQNKSFAEMVTVLSGDDWNVEGTTYVYQYDP